MRFKWVLATVAVVGGHFFCHTPVARACHLCCRGVCVGGTFYTSGPAPGPAGGGYGYTPYSSSGGTGYGYNPYWSSGGAGYGYNPYWNSGGTGYGYAPGTSYGYGGVNAQGLNVGALLPVIQQLLGVPGNLSNLVNVGLPSSPTAPSTSGTSGQRPVIDVITHVGDPVTSTPASDPALVKRVTDLETDVAAVLKIVKDAKAAGKL